MSATQPSIRELSTGTNSFHLQPKDLVQREPVPSVHRTRSWSRMTVSNASPLRQYYPHLGVARQSTPRKWRQGFSRRPTLISAFLARLVHLSGALPFVLYFRRRCHNRHHLSSNNNPGDLGRRAVCMDCQFVCVCIHRTSTAVRSDLQHFRPPQPNAFCHFSLHAGQQLGPLLALSSEALSLKYSGDGFSGSICQYQASDSLPSCSCSTSSIRAAQPGGTPWHESTFLVMQFLSPPLFPYFWVSSWVAPGFPGNHGILLYLWFSEYWDGSYFIFIKPRRFARSRAHRQGYLNIVLRRLVLRLFSCAPLSFKP